MQLEAIHVYIVAKKQPRFDPQTVAVTLYLVAFIPSYLKMAVNLSLFRFLPIKLTIPVVASVDSDMEYCPST